MTTDADPRRSRPHAGDGFLPITAAGRSAGARSSSRACASSGCPYETEPAITKHLAAFLTRARGDRHADRWRGPTRCCSTAASSRRLSRGSASLEALERWFGDSPAVLENDRPEAAVARRRRLLRAVAPRSSTSKRLIIRAGSARVLLRRSRRDCGQCRRGRRRQGCGLCDPGYQAIQVIPGIGPVLAGVFVAEVGDITRFGKPEQLTSWAGLTPKHHESDTIVHRGRITKQGSRLVRWAAVEAVQRLPTHTRIGSIRDRVAARRGRNIGVVAAARELTELVFYGLRDHHIRALLAQSPATA